MDIGGGRWCWVFPRMCVSLSPSVSTYVTKTFDRSPKISGDHRPRRFNLDLRKPSIDLPKSPGTTVPGDSISKCLIWQPIRTTGLRSGGSENLPNLEMRMHSCVEFCRAGGRHNECMGCSETGVVTGFAVWIVRVICAACIPVLAAFPTPFLKYQS